MLTMETERKVLFISATHGDEGFSTEILKDIERLYRRESYSYDWVIGNPEALTKQIRFTEADLNRSAPGNPNGTIYEERRASELMELSKDYAFVVDVHGSSNDCGIVTIIPYPSIQNLVLASAFNIENNVIWYAKSSIAKGPLVQFIGCPGIEIECGPKDSKEIQNALSAILRTFLTQGRETTILDLMNNLKNKSFYSVYGFLEQNNVRYTDFELATFGGEEFYPFLSKQYSGIACYKMKKVDFSDLFLE